MALASRTDYFKHILAVTFTNKATQEMKERILHYLNDFANGLENNLAAEIEKELGFTSEELRKRSKVVQSAILHQYSQFAISTIDAFFQKVIRSFTREAGLLGNFRLEVENDLVMKEVVNELMDELGTNQQLTDWVVEFSRNRLLDGENWNIVAALNGFAREIFSEEFQAIEDQLEKPTSETNPYVEIMKVLQGEIAEFEEHMKERAKEALRIIEEKGVTIDDFNNKDRGSAYKYFLEYSKGRQQDASKATMQAYIASPNNWAPKKKLNRDSFIEIAANHLYPILIEMVDYDKENGAKYNSILQVLKNFYAFGLIADITRKLKVYKQENNIMLLADAPKFLNGVINNSDTPFIYEKVGSYFQNYLIDEFQDTSGFQWKNFFPLLKDAIDQNQSSMVVGDVKQSIYRWRGGDQQLLQNEVEQAIGEIATDTKGLNTNYRSAEVVVDFNNSIFEKASGIVSDITGQTMATEAFKDVKQETVKYPGKGFVEINFIEKPDDDEDWTAEVMKRLPELVEELQDKKIKLRDIAILVRKNEEGQRIATELLQYKNTQAKPGYRYDVVSNESLRLDTAASVNLLLSALRYLHNPNDAIVRGQLAFEVTKEKDLGRVFLEAGKFHMDGLLPEEFLKQTGWLNKLSVFELTEELIRMFELGKEESELAYLQAFQDLVLEFSSMEKNDLATFLEWWENVKGKKSIQVAGNVDAINVLTIHKSKGLQFKYVIIPFLNWKLTHDQINAPLLWVQSDQPPFDTMGYLAVRHSSKLEGTYFEQDYKQELVKSYLDNLNLLYVSFTRAEEGLIAFASKPNKKRDWKPTSAGDLVYECIEGNEKLSPHFKENQLRIGNLELLNTTQPRNEYLPETLKHYASYDWRQKLVIKREGAEFFEEGISEKRASINYGILLHRLLAHIKYKSEAESVLNELHIKNEFTEEERVVLSEALKKMLDHEVVSSWFGKEWEVHNEVPVLIPGGRQSRIDRVMFGKKNTVIIDYKTGVKKDQDRTQVEGYAGLLTQMGYPNVQGYLLYLEELEVVEVLAGSTLSLF
ncbi:MAG: UvrD-helicase domain-containing protein [Cyclobacteriaceae bacterium]|nr:UvrD-helicase domain-containing protein [Cyclobacteriaceae bacterium]